MHFSTVFALLSLCGNALGARLAIPEVRHLGLIQREPEPELDKRITCIEDDYLLSFQMYIEDSYPSCSAYLGIPETTTTATDTAEATVFVIETTYTTFQQQTIIPEGTTTVTTTVPNTLAAPTFKKRQDGITPAAVVFSQCAEATGLNASLIHSVSSACSCLFITEKVNVVTTTSTQTRFEPGVDYRTTTELDIMTGPETTVYYTVKPTTYGPNPNVTTTSPTGSLSISGGGRGGSGSSTGSTSPTTSSAISGFGNTTTLPVQTGISSSQGSLSPSSPSFISSSGVPSASSVQPPPSSIPIANSSTATGASTGISSSQPSVFLTTTLSRATTVVISPSTGILSVSGNASTTSSSFTGSPTIPTGSRGGSSVTPSGSTSSRVIPSGSISSVIIPTGNSTTAPTPTSTSGPPTSSDCPSANGTIYTTQCQNFLIECYTNYGGPVDQGLVERSLYGCVDDCAIANVGFSQSRCYAASYFPNIVGPNCFFKTQKDSLTPFDNEETISALLLNPSVGNSSTQGCSVPNSNSTTTRPVTSTNSTKVSIPIATGSSVTFSSKTTNVTSIPSPSFSSAPASGSVLVTSNGTSIPPSSVPSASLSFSKSLPLSNGTSGISTGTGPLSTGTVPTARSTQPFSTGTVPRLPSGNSTTGIPTAFSSKTAPSFSGSIPSQSPIDRSFNGTTGIPPSTGCPSTKCTSYVYSTSVIYVTSVI